NDDPSTAEWLACEYSESLSTIKRTPYIRFDRFPFPKDAYRSDPTPPALRLRPQSGGDEEDCYIFELDA
ncbi:hypothetical protein, partial [Roseomonas mucosa]